MVYLYVGNKEVTEIHTISYVVPEHMENYKAIEEKDLPPEKEGFYRKLIYTKATDKITAEYTPVPPTETQLQAEVENLKQGLAQTTLELTNMIAMSSMK